MKHKLKDIVFSDINYSFGIENDNGKLINVKYKHEPLEFQTPKVLIEDFSDGKHLKLKLYPSGAGETFYSGIQCLEKSHSGYLKSKIKSIFEDRIFIVKIPSNKPITVYNNGMLFNYHHLVPGMEIICLVSCSTLWNNGYVLNAKEILITKCT